MNPPLLGYGPDSAPLRSMLTANITAMAAFAEFKHCLLFLAGQRQRPSLSQAVVFVGILDGTIYHEPPWNRKRSFPSPEGLRIPEGVALSGRSATFLSGRSLSDRGT